MCSVQHPSHCDLKSNLGMRLLALAIQSSDVRWPLKWHKNSTYHWNYGYSEYRFHESVRVLTLKSYHWTLLGQITETNLEETAILTLSCDYGISVWSNIMQTWKVIIYEAIQYEKQLMIKYWGNTNLCICKIVYVLWLQLCENVCIWANIERPS